MRFLAGPLQPGRPWPIINKETPVDRGRHKVDEKRTSPVTFAGQTELYYGTDAFRLQRLSLLPQEREEASEDLSGLRGRTWVVIRGTVKVSDGGSGQPRILRPGERAAFADGRRVSLVNEGGDSAEILMLEQFATVNPKRQPLGEVTETRPWGSFTVIRDEPYFKLKQLRVIPGKRLSLQRHQQREEHWFVLAGEPEVSVDQQSLRLNVGDYVKIPLHAWHRLANPGQVPVEIVELQLGQYFGEDDIERREDDFGRC